MKSKTNAQTMRKIMEVTSAVAVAAMLSGGAAGAAPVLNGALKEQVEFLCQRKELGRSEIRTLQKSAEFPVILAYALEKCPNVGAVLSDGATASIAAPAVPKERDSDRAPEREHEPRDKEHEGI